MRRALVALVAAGLACSGHTEGGPDAGDAGQGADAADGSATDASGEAEASAPLPYTGWIYIENRSNAQTTLFQSFGTFGATSALHACSGTMSGNCCYGAIAAVPPTEKAGSIDLHDGAAALGTLPYPYTAISSTTTPSLTWKAGDTLSIAAQGDASGLAAFSATVLAPPPLANVSPAFTSSTINMSTSNDFTVSFTGGGTSVSIDANTSTTFVNCRGATSAGSITIPHALLAPLSGAGIIEIFTFDETTATSSNASVSIYATNGELNQYVTFQ